jgi:hypothetical protein
MMFLIQNSQNPDAAAIQERQLRPEGRRRADSVKRRLRRR